MAQGETDNKQLEIRKYPNRRYYDSSRSRHLTLDEIRTLIQRGCDIRVVDAKTKEDITAQVLTQIILELETSKLDTFPVPLLLRVIRVNDQLVKDFIDKYFNQALHSFIAYQQQLEEQFRKAGGLPSSFPLVSAWAKAIWHPFTAAFGASGPDSQAASSNGPPSTEGGDRDVKETLRQLQQELEALKSARADAAKRPKRARPAPKRARREG
jgi:polyhydroxyalkanoate synthesis repressor PhaR